MEQHGSRLDVVDTLIAALPTVLDEMKASIPESSSCVEANCMQKLRLGLNATEIEELSQELEHLHQVLPLSPKDSINIILVSSPVWYHPPVLVCPTIGSVSLSLILGQRTVHADTSNRK